MMNNKIMNIKNKIRCNNNKTKMINNNNNNNSL